MRIVGGTHRGRALAPVGKGDPAAHLRPTSDRVRESLFNTLAGGRFGDPLGGARVLDVFAGTGALGFEALSRGAACLTCIENGRRALTLLKANRTLLTLAARIVPRDATRPGPAPEPHDLIFLDPPYGKGLGERALAALAAGDWIASGALVVWEERRPPVLPAHFTPLDQRSYGDSTLTFARHMGP